LKEENSEENKVSIIV